MDKKEEIYKQRQAIVEAVEKGPLTLFLRIGTMKRQWGFDHLMTKRYKERASADIGLIMSAYNLCRLFNILTFYELYNIFTKMAKKAQNCYPKAWWYTKRTIRNYYAKLIKITSEGFLDNFYSNFGVSF